jgi:hypothetical protein
MSFAYLHNLSERLEFYKGTFVALIDDRFLDKTDGVLGKTSDRRVGEVTNSILNQCVEVQYGVVRGQEKNTSLYDQRSLGYVSVTLKPTAPADGILGHPSEQKVGYIKHWSAWGTGDTVLIQTNETALNGHTYKVSDLAFHITTRKPVYGEKKDSRMIGGARRKTVRRSRTKNFFTRFMSRV